MTKVCHYWSGPRVNWPAVPPCLLRMPGPVFDSTSNESCSSTIRGEELMVRKGRTFHNKFAQKGSELRNNIFLGLGPWSYVTFSSVWWSPCMLIIYQMTWAFNHWQEEGTLFQLQLDFSMLRILSRVWRCCSSLAPEIKMLSIWTETPSQPCNKFSMQCWKMASAE